MVQSETDRCRDIPLRILPLMEYPLMVSFSLLTLLQTKDSGEGSINLNTTVETEDENEVEEVKEVRRPRPMGRDQAKRKMKEGSASSASSFDVAELAKMMAREYVMASDPYNTQKKQEMSELLKIKNQELKHKAAELEIRRMENRQRDEALYETKIDEALKERLRQRLFDYLQRALIDYQAEYGVLFSPLHCWEVLKDSEKWNSGELPAFRQERKGDKNKRYKSRGSSLFNTKDSGEGSINLNTTVETEDENEVEESPVEEIEEFQVPVTQKKPTRRRQTTPKKRPQKEKAVDQRCIPWTPEEETRPPNREGSINLNTTVETEDENEVEEVKEVHRPRPMGRDQTKRKMKEGSASSASSFDVAELAKMLAREYVMASDPYNTQKKKEMSELLKIKNQELKHKAAELEIRRMENRQRDEALYETKTDEALKERLRQRLFDENEVEEVKEVHRPRPMGRDQTKRKMKEGSASSASSFDVAELAKMLAREYVMASDPYNTQKKKEMSELLKIKNQELKHKAAELEIRRMENRQRDEALYETKTDEALKERLRQRLFG
nr:hypothetical protein [Tanacetum cinerariifolium]